MSHASPPTPASAVSALLADGVRYERGGVVARARECFESVSSTADEHPALAAEALWRLANLHRLHSNWDDALLAARESGALAREAGQPDIEADALNIEGGVWMMREEFEKARALFTRMLELDSSPGTRGKALQNLGGIAAELRDFDQAEQLMSQSLEIYRATGDARGEAIALLNIGRLQRESANLETARETLEAAVSGARLSGDLELHAAALLNLGITLCDLGLTSEAEERITTAYGQFTIAEIPVQRVSCLMQLATIAARHGEPEAARVCLLHAKNVADSTDLPRERRLIEIQMQALG